MSAELPSITVVIPAHNAARTIAAQLDGLCLQDYPGRWDVVVADNRSTDSTADIARSYCDRLRLRVVPALAGASVAYARNVGIAASTSELLVFFDADDVASPAVLRAYADRVGRFDVMGGHLDGSLLNDPVSASWRYSLTEGALPTVFGRFSFFVGANGAVSRRALDLVGDFNETLAFVGEDVDFSIRAQLAGLEIGWVPEAVVHYRHRSSIKALARQQFIYGRGSVVLYEMYRHVAVPANRIFVTLRQLANLLYTLPNVVRGRSLRGRWIMLASWMSGQLVESVRRRVWYVG